MDQHVKMGVNHEGVRLLEEDGKCVSPQIHKQGATFDGCIYQELEKLMLREIGCTVPWLPNKERVCVKEDERKTAFELYAQNRRNQVIYCTLDSAHRL